MSVECIDDSGECFDAGCITHMLRSWNGKEISFEFQKTTLSSLCNSLFSDEIHHHRDPLVCGRGVQPVSDSSSRASLVAMTCLGTSLGGGVSADINTNGNVEVKGQVSIRDSTEDARCSWSGAVSGGLEATSNGDVHGNVSARIGFEVEF